MAPSRKRFKFFNWASTVELCEHTESVTLTFWYIETYQEKLASLADYCGPQAAGPAEIECINKPCSTGSEVRNKPRCFIESFIHVSYHYEIIYNTSPRSFTFFSRLKVQFRKFLFRGQRFNQKAECGGSGKMILSSNRGHAPKWVNSQPEVAHMTKSISTSKTPRKKHAPEFRDEALKLASA